MCFILAHNILIADFTDRLILFFKFSGFSKGLRCLRDAIEAEKSRRTFDPMRRMRQLLIHAVISLPFPSASIYCTYREMQGVPETLRNYPDLQGCVVLREGTDTGAKLSLALTVRDNTSQLQLSKIRRGWKEEGRSTPLWGIQSSSN